MAEDNKSQQTNLPPGTQAPPADDSEAKTEEEVASMAAPAVEPVEKEVVQPQSPTEQPVEAGQKLEKINREFKEKEAERKAQEIGMAYINIALTPINPDLLKLIPPEIAKKALILAFFKLGKKLRVAVADPENPETRKVIEDLKATGYAINVNLSTDDALLEAMKVYDTDQYLVKKELDTKLEEEKFKAYEKEISDLKVLNEKIKTVTSEEAVYLINIGGLKTGASDIHYEPAQDVVTIRFRIDGVLHKIFEIERSVYTNIINQIKYQCKMRLNVTNEPQDGRYNFIVNDRGIDVRVSALPTQFGETFVCRLLDSEKQVAKLDELGFTRSTLAHMKSLLKLKHGMILVTGPTGSGKTTTLYTLLENFSQPENKVITLEDPIEYHLKGISQSQINEKRGYNFSSGLRSILRQDPDVVMIGEIRDFDTAEAAATAALTGHVLLSTLHTNSAIESIPRLINMGLPPFMVAPALDTIIAQRLVRKFCPECAEEKSLSKSKREELETKLEFINKVQPALKLTIPDKLPVAHGCDVCSHTGYKGRISVMEMLDVDTEMRRLILEKASSTKLIEAARRKGMLTMYEDGIIKVIEGVTSLTEVHRVTAIVV